MFQANCARISYLLTYRPLTHRPLPRSRPSPAECHDEWDEDRQHVRYAGYYGMVIGSLTMSICRPHPSKAQVGSLITGVHAKLKLPPLLQVAPLSDTSLYASHHPYGCSFLQRKPSWRLATRSSHCPYRDLLMNIQNR